MHLPNLEKLSIPEIEVEISARLRWIEVIRRDLPYADHGAYSQDLNAINGYQEELEALNRQLNQLKQKTDIFEV